MDKLCITGGKPLSGRIRISGAKNAALPLMTACLLTDRTITLTNVPYLADITTMMRLLAQHGVQVSLSDDMQDGRKIVLQADNITSLTAPYDIVRTMRASVLVLGPLLARFGEAKVSLPGGCAIGTRPVDLHLSALEQMGATIELSEGYVIANAPANGLKAADIAFEKVSVGATENILMAACLAEGTTILRNAAKEPEIGDLVHLLQSMGAEISGIHTDTLTIKGKAMLKEAAHRIIPDRIEAGSYLCAAGITDGELELVDARPQDLQALMDILHQAGVHATPTKEGLHVHREATALRPVDITTAPHPDFPTDMQAQMMALLSLAAGTSHITETIFENRFMHVPELLRMGADIAVENDRAAIHGVERLKGAPVMATDLRASMSLVLAALAAEGETIINRVYHLDRGYEQLEEKLSACGATIKRQH